MFRQLSTVLVTSYKKRRLICGLNRTDLSLRFLKILRYYGFIYGYTEKDLGSDWHRRLDGFAGVKLPDFYIFLRYVNGRPAITNLQFVSKPSCRKYGSIFQIQKSSLPYSPALTFVSTSLGLIGLPRRGWGVLNLKNPRGGEILCKVW